MKLTKWYKSNQKPVRIGYYECKCCNNKFWWNGKVWLYGEHSYYELQMNEWRGIAK